MTEVKSKYQCPYKQYCNEYKVKKNDFKCDGLFHYFCSTYGYWRSTEQESKLEKEIKNDNSNTR
jgi:hypothetical protein